MATVNELKSVLKETLENRGVLGQIRARVRAEVFSALDDQTEPRPALSNENLLINELIREYLTFNKYKYTESVLQAESGQPKEPMDRRFLVQELNIKEEESPTMPLLYGILAHFLQGSHNEGRQFTGARQEPMLRSHTRDQRSRRNAEGSGLLGGRDDRGRMDASFVHDPEPVVVRGGR
ncbi:lisH domain-containing protein FOPNL-like [Pocillopora damicornis]|uniref:lisH domain-containing protein FOPNL-like n=1 Tax=Pocillopora damicornis TaxID=46731 RepID=UPI000F5545DF|nr:lisH domain-containing protein FOPNL-like [Pocillopora damicornis]